MKIPRLPAPVGSVVAPHHFAPSRFEELRQCSLRVFADPDKLPGALARGPSASFGLLLHHVRHELLAGRWGGEVYAERALDRLMQAARVQMDRMLESDPQTERLVPLARTIGREKWNTRALDLRQWAVRLEVTPTGEEPLDVPAPKSDSHAASESPAADVVEFGPEARVICNSLRLRGRADHRRKAVDGSVEISEFSSGRIFDDSGEPKPRHLVQLRLYGLAAEHVTGAEVRLYLEDSERTAVPWDEGLKQSLAEDLAGVHDEFPPGTVHAAETTAHPGTWCRFCRLRPVCSRYLRAAPDWWPNSVGALRPLPLDVWGRVSETQSVGQHVNIELIDAAGRFVRIEGLDPIRGVADLRAGDEVYFFDLKATEPTNHHGDRVQPRNFHELPPDGGLIFERARGLQLFRGQA